MAAACSVPIGALRVWQGAASSSTSPTPEDRGSEGQLPTALGRPRPRPSYGGLTCALQLQQESCLMVPWRGAACPRTAPHHLAGRYPLLLRGRAPTASAYKLSDRDPALLVFGQLRSFSASQSGGSWRCSWCGVPGCRLRDRPAKKASFRQCALGWVVCGSMLK